ncbi:baseplate J/gp47 family protein [Kordia jejudonensis]|uniref:baseplate J/gp47 family protein n=1 Tax=Kordia jejudonensis TaxID=1348245 RepID=UPI0006996D21|nr:baseplate J/gp47 family protein [Kordia jejudonensis]
MQNDCTENTLIKLREGTTQQSRYHALLDPESVELMGFDVKDWMNFAEEFSKHVNLYNNKNYTTPTGTWEPFHNASEEIKEVIETYAEGDVTPQLALFIAFLKLLNQSKERFNKITKRHLDFYYKKVLQLDKNDENADHAYIIFELAKNAEQQFLSDETLLNAGKDADGNTIHYQLEEEIVINKATVSALKNTYAHEDAANWYASPIANSEDGEGGEFETGSTSWLPFGDTDRNLAKKGFSVSSPSLLLTEGKRTITLIASYNKLVLNTNLKPLLTVEHTGEKGWETPTVKSAVVKNNKITIEITLNEDDEKIVNYDTEIHEGNYTTTHPIIRVLFDQNDRKETTFETYTTISEATLESVELATTGIYKTGITVKNDLGKVNTENPFFPFGPLAKKRAKLKISSKEWIGKRISDVTVSLDWKDNPDNFETHYKHYIQQYLNITPPETFISVHAGLKTPIVTGANGSQRFRVLTDYIGSTKDIVESVAEVDKVLLSKEEQFAQEVDVRLKTADKNKDAAFARPFNQDEAAALSYDYSADRDDAQVNVTSDGSDSGSVSDDLSNGTSQQDQQMFTGTSTVEFKHFLPTNRTYVPKITDDYFIQLSLQNNFLHDAYAKIYTYLALHKFALPNAPYAPFAENLKVAITTKEVFSETKNELELYHELPFGINKIKTSNATLVPQPENGGQLYIGIDKAVADQNIQLLCQIEEGSENPDAIEAYQLATVTWQYLYKNTWINLKPIFLLKDQTDNFLKAGLVAFTVPKRFGENTLFIEDYLWIRATIDEPYDTVSKFTNIHAQAVEVKFLNKENTLDHLENGMPAETISKLKDRLATVKKVTQPYASFDGFPKESDLDFYRRVSERLRHKNRAITLWDYEHLILQEFNYLHKIKCLNHSTRSSFKTPGEVLLVAVPNIKDQNVYDIYKPKLSQTKLNAIETYINKLNTLHVNAKVISPVYEEVRIGLKARFYEGLDANFYAKQLQQDIAQYLSPWAFDKDQMISFGNAMYASEVIFYIENLNYVDYIKDFKMLHDGEEKDEIIPTDQKSILTSVLPELHAVNAITTTLCQS